MVHALEIQVLERTAELRKETERLQDALANVRTLSGLIPICARCKSVRTDDGYWKQVETYLSEYTGIIFSHGVCPDCAKILFPGSAGDEPS